MLLRKAAQDEALLDSILEDETVTRYPSGGVALGKGGAGVVKWAA